MEKVLIVCKPSGKDAFGSVMYFLGLVAGSIYFEILDELNMYPVDESSIEIVTSKGKTYRFGDNIGSQEVGRFIQELEEEMKRTKVHRQ